ncbi:enoyl-CoA hydratase-related protein [Aestuariivirga sp. YIM B02566]|uniref:Enoyl-CoA hydratase/isomerase family protein n=1 Tax=Taklimakanibacter albus TaxID=2800327 RepID=A0ACC5QZM9_9HYPH|nr:enoyl-CoA hydratase/isomerase family protein [Aestuariivirga sp. YIM B02566]
MMDGVRVELEGAVALITLDRPAKRNALERAMVEGLAKACRDIEHSAARVAILTGAGDKSFSAGGDIAAWSADTPEEFGRFWVREGHLVFDALARLRQPLIAVLNGDCLGGGLELAACADYRIAERHARFGQPETGLGIIPGWSGTQRTVRRFGSQVVRRMALFGEVFDADTALGLGLVDRVCERGEGIAVARSVANELLNRSPQATELTKMLINAAEGEERERVLDAIAGQLAAGSRDLAKGLEAFRNKKKPEF